MSPPPRRRAAALSCAAVAGALALSGCTHPDRPHRLLLVTVDTLRADRLGCYGSTEGLTPRLDALAAEGAALEQVIVPIPRTTQSVASLLTGRTPAHHGARGLFDALPPGGGRTLGEVLKEAGFETAAFGSNIMLRPGQGFERGFSLYDNPAPRWERNGASATIPDALDWIAHQGGSRWFLWIHLLDPHWSYEPAAPFDARAGGLLPEDLALYRDIAEGHLAKGDVVFGDALPAERARHLTALYDGEVAATDAAIGLLLDGLRALELAEGTLVVVTADHGESLGEHGYRFAHGEVLYENNIRVPALVRAPGLVPAGSRPKRLVRSYDLMPTLLDLLGVAKPAGIDGVSRAGELRGGPEGPEAREIYLETDSQFVLSGNPKRFFPGWAGSWRGLRDEQFKVVRIPRPGADLLETFDLHADPEEARNLSEDGATPLPQEADLVARLAAAEAAAGAPAAPAPSPPGTDPERLRLLRSLGYLETGGGI